MRLLDPKQKEGMTDVDFAGRKLEDLYLGEGGRKANPEVVRFLAARHTGDLTELAARLTKQERGLVIEDLFAHSADGLRKNPPKGGVEAFEAAAELAGKEPDARWAKVLANLKLATVPFQARTAVALSAVQLANALAKHDPATVKTLRPAMEAFLKSEHVELSTVGSGDMEISAGIVLSVESQIGGDDVEEYRRLFRGAK